MKKTMVRCINCGQVYDNPLNKDCPLCHYTIADRVLVEIPTVENKVIVDFNAVMYNFPKVFGIPITGKN